MKDFFLTIKHTNDHESHGIEKVPNVDKGREMKVENVKKKET